MKIVPDTNVFVSALIVPAGKPAQILRSIGKSELLTTEEILTETERVLHYSRIQKRYHVSDEDIHLYLERLREVCTIVQPTTRVAVIDADPDDDKFLALASEVKADYIVSGDPHLTNLKEYEDIPIITPAQFLKLLKRGE